MESVTALVAGGLAIALSCYVGRSMATTTLVSAMMGAVCGLGFAILFFVATVTLGALVPGIFNGWTLGTHFILLLMVLPPAGAGVAALAHRHVERIEARRLPF